MITNFLSNMLIKPGLAPVFDNPANYGLDYEDVTFETRDGVTLSGWLIKGGAGKVVVQSHFGVQCSRAGYTPKGKGVIKVWKKDISFLKHAKHLADSGYSVLMYDFRNHGNSGPGPNPWITYGLDESLDVEAAVQYISNRPDYSGCTIGLLSICMGACSTTYAYGQSSSLKDNDRIKAMIAVQPLTYSGMINSFKLPSFLANRVRSKNQTRAGFDYVETTFMPYAKDLTIPTMVVQNSNDPMLDREMLQTYFDDLPAEKEMKWLDLEKNRFGAYAYLPEHPEFISEFFDRNQGG